MNIDLIVTSLRFDGFWYTYHKLTAFPYEMRRRDALWLIWVARQHTLHKDGRSMRERFIDWALN